MANYRRVWQAGGTYFFTVNILERKQDLLVQHIVASRLGSEYYQPLSVVWGR